MNDQVQSVIKSIVIRLPRSEARQLRVLAAERDTTVQDLVAGVIRRNLFAQAVPTAQTSSVAAAPTDTAVATAQLPRTTRTSSSRRVILTGAALEAASRPHVPGVQHRSLAAAVAASRVVVAADATTSVADAASPEPIQAPPPDAPLTYAEVRQRLLDELAEEGFQNPFS